MYRLGLRLVLRGNRESLTRLLVTTSAVAIAVTILLGIFSDFHAYQKTSDRPSWEATSGTAVGGSASLKPNALLWNYSENIYKGRFIEQLDIARLGPNSPVPPGVTSIPDPGQFYVSPALASLLNSVPRDELGNRFPGRQVGIIGEQALSFPSELAIYVGYSPSNLVKLGGTIVVTHIAASPQLQGTTNIYREAFGIGALAILFPLLILVNTATRLAAARREERYAAMRLIGATPNQVNVIASVDAVVGSLLGTIFGSLIFLVIRPAIADISVSGVSFFPNYVTPTVWGYVGMLIGVPIIAAIASLISLRRVQISPLSVIRKTSSSKPSILRLVPLLIGIILFTFGGLHVTLNGTSKGPLLMLLSGFLLIMIGIVSSGSWLTKQLAGVFGTFAQRPSTLLSARRLSDNPKGAFRAVSGVVLAVFVGSVISLLIPALNQMENPSGQSSLSDVLKVPLSVGGNNPGIPPRPAYKLVKKMESYTGTAVIPLYTNPAFTAFQQRRTLDQGSGPSKGIRIQPGTGRVTYSNAPNDTIASCTSLAQVRVLGTCAPGEQEVSLNSGDVMNGDNPLFIYKSLPLVTHASPPSTADLSSLPLAGMLIRTSNPNTLERIRTYLTVYESTSNYFNFGGKGKNLTAYQMGVIEPETVGEVAAIRTSDISNVGRGVLAVIALILITAGCSIAVTVGGSLVERRRSFTMLRISGVSLKTLYRVVLFEAIMPLIMVSLVGAGVGLGVGAPVIKALLINLSSKTISIPVHPSMGYFIAIGSGLALAIGLVSATLPLLKRITRPETARFE